MIEEWSQLDEHRLRELFVRSQDVKIDAVLFGPAGFRHKVVLLYCQGMSHAGLIDRMVMPALQSMLTDAASIDAGLLETNSPLVLSRITGPDGMDEFMLRLYSGQLILFFESAGLMYAVNTSSPPNRTPDESSTEVSVKGPRDAFTEDLSTNIALVRKRLLTHSLCCEIWTIGERSHTSVALLYIGDVANPGVVEQARDNLAKLKVDGLLSSGQLEEGFTGVGFALVPLVDYIGRPDFVADSLLRGRIGVMVDGSPMVLLAPVNLAYILKSPEDVHFPSYYVFVQRLLRSLGLLTTVFFPGFYIAVTSFNFDQIPFPLLATIASVRIGLPMSGPMDFFLMQGLFEMFREAGVRLPKAVGQTVAVVGGLIVGDAAIRAGITGPATLVAVAISTMAMFTLVNQSLAGSVTVLRLAILVVSSVLGMFGFIVSVVALTLYLATLESFGVPYMAPLSPLSVRDLFSAMKFKKLKIAKRRPSFLKPTDDTRKRGER